METKGVDESQKIDLATLLLQGILDDASRKKIQDVFSETDDEEKELCCEARFKEGCTLYNKVVVKKPEFAFFYKLKDKTADVSYNKAKDFVKDEFIKHQHRTDVSVKELVGNLCKDPKTTDAEKKILSEEDLISSVEHALGRENIDILFDFDGFKKCAAVPYIDVDIYRDGWEVIIKKFKRTFSAQALFESLQKKYSEADPKIEKIISYFLKNIAMLSKLQEELNSLGKIGDFFENFSVTNGISTITELDYFACKDIEELREYKTQAIIYEPGDADNGNSYHAWSTNLAWVLGHLKNKSIFRVISPVISNELRRSPGFENTPSAFAREICTALKAGYELIFDGYCTILQPSNSFDLTQCVTDGSRGNGINPSNSEIAAIFLNLKEKYSTKQPFNYSFIVAVPSSLNRGESRHGQGLAIIHAYNGNRPFIVHIDAGAGNATEALEDTGCVCCAML